MNNSFDISVESLEGFANGDGLSIDGKFYEFEQTETPMECKDCVCSTMMLACAVCAALDRTYGYSWHPKEFFPDKEE